MVTKDELDGFNEQRAEVTREGIAPTRAQLVSAVRLHDSSGTAMSITAVRDLRALEAATPDFRSDAEATAAAAHLHRARLSVMQEDSSDVDLVATAVLFSLLLPTAADLVPVEVQRTLELSPLPEPAFGLGEWASLAFDEAVASQDPEGIQHALLLAERASNSAGAAEVMPYLLSLRARGYHQLHEWSDDLESLDRAVASWREYAAAIAPDDGDYASAWSNLGVVLDRRARRCSDDKYSSEAIDCAQRAIDHAPDVTMRARCLNNLSSALSGRARPGDATAAIGASRECVSLTAGDDAARASRLTNLGIALVQCYEDTGNAVLRAEAVEVFSEAVELTPFGDPALHRRTANLDKARDAVTSRDSAPVDAKPARRTRSSLLRSAARSRVSSWTHRLDRRLRLLDCRYSTYQRTRPRPNLRLGMHEHAVGGPVAGRRSAASLPPALVGLDDLVSCAIEWLRNEGLWTGGGLIALTVGLQWADLSWSASAFALVLVAGIDRVVVGRAESISQALRFCPISTGVVTVIAGAGLGALAGLAEQVTGARGSAVALAAVLGWGWVMSAITKPAVAAELAFSKGERRRVPVPAPEAVLGGLSVTKIRKAMIVPMMMGPFSDEFEMLLVDRPSWADRRPTRREAVRHARQATPRAFVAAGLVGLPAAGLTTILCAVMSPVGVVAAVGYGATAGMFSAAEKLRTIVDADRRVAAIDEGRAARPSLTVNPQAAMRFAEFGPGQPVGEQHLGLGNRPARRADLPFSGAAGDDADEVWE